MKIKIKVIANSKINSIEKEDDLYKVHLTERAIDGKANKALIYFLADHFKCKKQNIEIVSGQKSRNKVIEIHQDNS
jgi:uncharacterized protein (TIGR00251 family)